MNSWIQYQLRNKANIIRHDCFKRGVVQYVAGLDISFEKSDSNRACAYLTVFDLKTKSNVYENFELCVMDIPYISGFLGFREVPFYKTLLEKIKDEPFYPDVALVDGCGILHPHEFGSASHLGFEMDLPTIGVAKTLMQLDGLKEKQIKKQFLSTCFEKGNHVNLIGTSGTTWGAALKTSESATNPVYVSIGHKISLPTALDIVTQCCIHRVPEPIRNSDIQSKLHF